MKKILLAFTMLFGGHVSATETKCDSTSYQIAQGGGDKGNGGFRDSEGTGTMLLDAQTSLLGELKTLLALRESKIYSSESCAKSADLNKLNEMIEKATYNPLCQSIGVNLDRINEQRWFRINASGNVEATKRFFDLFHGIYTVYYSTEKDASKKTQLVAPIREGMIHEALHEFGYDQAEAKKCASDLVSAIESYNPEKLEAAQKEVIRQNDLKVKDLMVSSKCMDEKHFNSFNKSGINYPAGTYLLIGQRLSLCLQDASKDLARSQPMNMRVFFEGVGYYIVKGKSLVEVASYINKHLDFSFEDKIPTKK